MLHAYAHAVDKSFAFRAAVHSYRSLEIKIFTEAFSILIYSVINIYKNLLSDILQFKIHKLVLSSYEDTCKKTRQDCEWQNETDVKQTSRAVTSTNHTGLI